MNPTEARYRQLHACRRAVAERVVARQLRADAALAARLGDEGRARWIDYGERQVEVLAQSLRANEPQLFLGYVIWLSSARAGRGQSPSALRANLKILAEVVAEEAPLAAEEAAACLRRAMASLEPPPPPPLSFLQGDYPLRPLAEAFTQALLEGDRREASRLILEAADGGVALRALYLEVFQRSQREVGRLWQLNQITVAQEHFCTAATQLVISQLYPRLFTGRPGGPTVVATCVEGNLHELGVRTVADFFELEGWQSHYLGASTPHDAVASALVSQRADVLAISATLISQVADVEALIGSIRSSAATQHIKILVGGAPFSVAPGLGAAVGADGTAGDAQSAVDLASTMVSSA